MVKYFILFVALFSLTTLGLAQDIQVVSGDTLVIDNVTYRLEGIDAPEIDQNCQTQNGNQWPCGKRAAEHLSSILFELAGAKEISCEGNKRDACGRIIASCTRVFKGPYYDIAKMMIQDGYAWIIPEHSTKYISEQKQAKAEKKGVWQAHTQTPWDFRAERDDVLKEEGKICR